MRLGVTYTPLATRLSRYYQLDEDHIHELENTVSHEVQFKAGDSILRRNAAMKHLMVMVSGWAIRCRYTRAGTRQIIHVLLPGDVLTPDVFVIKRSDHAIVTLTDTVVRQIEPRDMNSLFHRCPHMAAAFWWASEQEDGILREHIVRLGRRSAEQRVLHLFLELHRRLLLVDQATEDTFVLPLTQNDVADVLGLSSVHVNRTLRKLDKEGLIQYQGSVIQIPSREALSEMCDFDLSHLHLDSTVANAIFRES